MSYTLVDFLVKRPYDREQLPCWFTRPEPCSSLQPTLFGLDPKRLVDVLAALRISTDDLERWRGSGWVSFDTSMTDRLEQWHVDELQFVRDVVRSGFPDAQVKALLEELPRPLRLSPDLVTYSFSLGWVQAIPWQEPEPDEYISENLDQWLDSLAESGAAERLTKIRDRIDGLVTSLVSGDEGDPDE